jgi:hypothetical protein
VCLIYPTPRVGERRRWLGASPQDVPSQALAGSMVASIAARQVLFYHLTVDGALGGELWKAIVLWDAQSS